ALNAKQRVLRAAVAFFPYPQLGAPQVAENGVPAGQRFVAKALRARDLKIAVFGDHVLHPPFGVVGRTLHAAAEVSVVFHLQLAEVVFELREFFVTVMPHQTHHPNTEARRKLSMRMAKGSAAGTHTEKPW